MPVRVPISDGAMGLPEDMHEKPKDMNESPKKTTYSATRHNSTCRPAVRRRGFPAGLPMFFQAADNPTGGACDVRA